MKHILNFTHRCFLFLLFDCVVSLFSLLFLSQGKLLFKIHTDSNRRRRFIYFPWSYNFFLLTFVRKTNRNVNLLRGLYSRQDDGPINRSWLYWCLFYKLGRIKTSSWKHAFSKVWHFT